MDENQHRELARVLKHCRAKVAVSGYDHPVMKELFPSSRWMKTIAIEKTNHATKGTRQEVLWTNYKASPQEDLFK
jgi:DNA adenine methylase